MKALIRNRSCAALALAAASLVFASCGARAEAAPEKDGTAALEAAVPGPEPAAATGKTVTFIELGSVNCIPCKAMQPIMDEIGRKYPDQVEVVFHDVWTPQGRPFASKYGLRVIPTQVFLNAQGVEFFRHEGFLPMDQLLEVLKQGGVDL